MNGYRVSDKIHRAVTLFGKSFPVRFLKLLDKADVITIGVDEYNGLVMVI